MILCGDYGVGKTSLFRRFYLDDFYADDDAAKSSMLGMDFSTRQFDVGDGCSAKVDMTQFDLIILIIRFHILNDSML